MGRPGSASGAEPPRVGDRLEVELCALDEAFRGVGEAGGVEVHVPGALAGETIEVEVEHVDRRSRAFSRLVRVVRPSSERVAVPCARFLECSGCDALHASLEVQHAEKRARVARTLGVALGVVEPVVPSPRAVGYRALAKLVVGPGATLGSYRARTHDVTSMHGCVVHAPEAEAVVERLRAGLRARGSTSLRYVVLRASITEGRVIVVLVTAKHDPIVAEELQAIARELAVDAHVASVHHHVNASTGDALFSSGPFLALFDRGPVRETLLGLSYTLRPGAFAQINPLAAERLYARVVELMGHPLGRILDLYSGSAGIALALAKAGAESVVGVESSAEAVEAGRAAAVENGVEARVLLEAMRAEDALGRLAGTRFDAVAMNPPRKGADREVLLGLCRLSVRRIVYVSCNPDTLARDLALLRTEGGFGVERIVPVDLFPQTRHVETVALVTR